MISLLIDAILLLALVVTALRSGRMYRELKALRASEAGLAAALSESERSLNKAAEAVIALKYDGLEMMRGLESQCQKARDAEQRLFKLVERADYHVSGTARSAPTDYYRAAS